MVSPVPLKVKINANSAVEEKQILAPNSSGRETIARGQNASINSTTPGANGDAHRIHLNTQDIRMMKDLFRDSTQRKLTLGGEPDLHQRKNSLSFD